MISQILEQYDDIDFLKLDNFDSAIIGVSENFNESHKLIYSVSKIIEILEKDMTREEAFEYFTFNVGGSYLGEKTPIFCWDNFE